MTSECTRQRAWGRPSFRRKRIIRASRPNICQLLPNYDSLLSDCRYKKIPHHNERDDKGRVPDGEYLEVHVFAKVFHDDNLS